MEKLKFIEWDGKALKGDWVFSIKKDGIQAQMTDDRIVTRNGKPLYNLPGVIPRFKVAEIFCGSWNETWSIVSASKSPRREVLHEEIYTIIPMDSRLILYVYAKGSIVDINNPSVRDPTVKCIKHLFHYVRGIGEEGLVMYNAEKDLYVKVKDKKTVDAPITALVKSTAKSHYGLLKEFVTPFGRVGTGLTKFQRIQYMDEKLIGTFIEVGCTEITKNGKWRNPRFIRLRPDK